MRYHMAAIPFENLELHYSPHHTVTLDMQDICTKIVERNAGRGGRCMENNGFFGTVLRGLGYEVMNGAGRVNQAIQPCATGKNFRGPSYDGWNHMINVVTMDGRRFLIDVGMGSNGPVVPLALEENQVTTSVPPRQVRLRRGPIPEHTSAQSADAMLQYLWLYEHRRSEDGPWILTYAFCDIEFLPQDYEMMSWYTSTNRRSWFTHKVICGKMVLAEAGEEVVGDITLFERTVGRRIHGKAEVLAELETERERTEALERWLDVRLTESGRKGIRGMMTEIT